MNVAYGGTLDPTLHEWMGCSITGRDESPRLTCSTGLHTKVLLEPGGCLRKSPDSIACTHVPALAGRANTGQAATSSRRVHRTA